MLKERGVPLILGLRDVMDEPALLAPEWERKNVLPALRDLSDDIWVYGLPQVCDPLAGLELPRSVRRKMTFTGYLRRNLPPAQAEIGRASCTERVGQYGDIPVVGGSIKKQKTHKQRDRGK